VRARHAADDDLPVVLHDDGLRLLAASKDVDDDIVVALISVRPSSGSIEQAEWLREARRRAERIGTNPTFREQQLGHATANEKPSSMEEVQYVRFGGKSVGGGTSENA
jgi:hypothetical protein